jgi:predicted DCC family thiol-disulfide oxidoreductase YuxK
MKQPERILVYDGECYLCNGFVNRVLKLDKAKRFHFSPYQSEFGKALIAQYHITHPEKGILLIDSEKVYHKSSAVIRTGVLLGFPHYLIAGLWIIPSFIRNLVYDWVAKNRYKWFGKSETCIVPKPEVKQRFLLESN